MLKYRMGEVEPIHGYWVMGNLRKNKVINLIFIAKNVKLTIKSEVALMQEYRILVVKYPYAIYNLNRIPKG